MWNEEEFPPLAGRLLHILVVAFFFSAANSFQHFIIAIWIAKRRDVDIKRKRLPMGVDVSIYLSTFFTPSSVIGVDRV